MKKILPKDEIEILVDVIEKLNMLEIEYMLTGSVAMNYYAEPRMTRDIDIIIEIGSANKDEIFNTFHEQYYFTGAAFDEAIRCNSMFNIIHKKAVAKIDFIIRKKDQYSIQALKRKQSKKINNHIINIISKEDLIISKIKWAQESKSELQKKDILNLLETGYEKEYIVNCLENCDLLGFAKEFVGERYFS